MFRYKAVHPDEQKFLETFAIKVWLSLTIIVIPVCVLSFYFALKYRCQINLLKLVFYHGPLKNYYPILKKSLKTLAM